MLAAIGNWGFLFRPMVPALRCDRDKHGLVFRPPDKSLVPAEVLHLIVDPGNGVYVGWGRGNTWIIDDSTGLFEGQYRILLPVIARA